MKTMKKTIALLLTLMMLMSLCSVTSLAGDAEGQVEGQAEGQAQGDGEKTENIGIGFTVTNNTQGLSVSPSNDIIEVTTSGEAPDVTGVVNIKTGFESSNGASALTVLDSAGNTEINVNGSVIGHGYGIAAQINGGSSTEINIDGNVENKDVTSGAGILINSSTSQNHLLVIQKQNLLKNLKN